jgi:hypothetical protein
MLYAANCPGSLPLAPSFGAIYNQHGLFYRIIIILQLQGVAVCTASSTIIPSCHHIPLLARAPCREYMAERGLVDPDRLVELSFDELDTDPIGVLRRVYSHFG